MSMAGRMVSVTNLDSVRVEVLGESRALTVPANFVLAVDRVLRYCLEHDDQLSLDTCEDEGTGETLWEASLGNSRGFCGETPWGAVVALADAIDAGEV
jgi:hypothetical protein